MPWKIKTKIFLTFIFVGLTLIGLSQQKDQPERDWQFNYNLGFSQFYGDASNNGYFKKFSGEIGFATGFSVRKYLSPAFGLGFDFLYSGLKSHKEKRATGEVVNFGLTGSYFDGNVNLLVDFNSLFWDQNKNRFSVYGKIGLGYCSWNTELSDSLSGGVISSGTTIGSTMFKSGGFVMPAGLGVNYMLGTNWALNFEINLRTVLNDDVDVWRDGFKYDQPLYTSIGISYFLNGTSGRKVKNKTKSSASTLKPVGRPVNVYNYRKQPERPKSEGPSTPEAKPTPAKVVDVVYRVQILAKRQNLPSIAALKNRFNISGDIYENVQNGLHRYSTGEFSTYGEALKHSHLLKSNGVHDAFVVAYRNNKRVVITTEMKKN